MSPRLLIILSLLAVGACRTQPLNEAIGVHPTGKDLAAPLDLPSDLAHPDPSDLARADPADLARSDLMVSAEVDQLNLGPHYWCPPSGYALGQTFTVGRSGVLVGIEVAMGQVGPPLPTDQVTLTLTDATSAALLGSASIATNQLAEVCIDEPPLSAETRGRGYFDLSALPIVVSAGRVLRFDLSASGAGVQIGVSHGGWFGVPDYPGGSSFSEGGEQPGDDLLFKTFMQ